MKEAPFKLLNMKKILIPTNLTLDYLNLIKYGLQIYKGETCQFILLHVIPSPESTLELLMLPREEDRLEKVNPSFTKTLERIKKSFVVEIENLIVTHIYGESPAKMKNFLEANEIDLILCPVSPRNKATSEEAYDFSALFKKAACPVMYVPESLEVNKFRKIAYVLDLEDTAPLQLDDMLLNLTNRCDYHITFLAVFEPGTQPDKLSRLCQKIYLNDKLKNVACSLHFLQEQDATEGFSSFVEEYKVDLLVTGKRKSEFKDLFSWKKQFTPSPKHQSVPFLTVA
jgi:hypothetical protein